MRLRTGLLAALVMAALVSCSSDDSSTTTTTEAAATEIVGLQRDQPLDVSDVSLPEEALDGTTTPFTMTAPPGELLLVYFGYTACPDVCPTTMSDIKGALSDVDGAERVSVAMVTVDPERDTAEVLDGYVGHFVDRYHVLRTTDGAELETAEDAFGASSSVTTAEDGTVEVAHTGTLYAVDDTGTVIVEWPFGTPRDALTSDLRLLLERTSSAGTES